MKRGESLINAIELINQLYSVKFVISLGCHKTKEILDREIAEKSFIFEGWQKAKEIPLKKSK